MTKKQRMRKSWVGLLAVLLMALVCLGAMADEEPELEVGMPAYLLQNEQLGFGLKLYEGATQYTFDVYESTNTARYSSTVVTAEQIRTDATDEESAGDKSATPGTGVVIINPDEDGFYEIRLPASAIPQAEGVHVIDIIAQEVTGGGATRNLCTVEKYFAQFTFENNPVTSDDPDAQFDPHLIISKQNSYSVNSPLIAEMFAPGATGTMVRVGSEAVATDYDFATVAAWLGHTGTYTVTGTAYYADGGEPATLTETIVVTEEAKSLGQFTVAFPESITAGQATVTMTGTKVTGAVDSENIYYGFQIADLTNGYQQMFRKIFVTEQDELGNDESALFGDGQTVTYTAGNTAETQFQAGHTYRLEAWANCYGYTTIWEHKEYSIPTTTPFQMSASFDVKEGQTLQDGMLYVTANEDLFINVTLTGNQDTIDSIETIRLYNGWEYEDLNEWNGPVEQLKEDGEWSFDRWYDEGDYVIFLQAGYREENSEDLTWVTSNVLYVRSDADGYLPEQKVSLSKSIVTRGENIIISGPEGGWDDNIVEAQAWIEDPYYNVYYGEFRLRSDGTIWIPTIMIEPGYYMVTVESKAIGQGLTWTVEYIQVVEQEDDLPEITLLVDKNELQTQENYTLTAYAPGANWIDVFFDYENGEDWCDTWNGENFIDQRSYDHSGEYKMVARAHYIQVDENGNPLQNDDGSWVELDPIESEEVTISVTAEADVEIIDPKLPSYIVEGQGLSFAVAKPTNAEKYNISVQYYDPDMDRDFVLLETDDITSDRATVSIPAEGMPPVNPMSPKSIQIHIYGYGDNVNAAKKQWDIPLVQAPDEEHPVSIALVHPNDPILLNQSIEFRVSTSSEEEIKLVCIYDGYNYSDHYDPNDGNAYNTELSFWEERTYPVYALVTFDEAPEGYDWDNNPDPRTWYTTNVIEVTPTKTGDTGEFSFDVDCVVNPTYGYATVARGDDITITYQAAQYATHYWIDVEQYNEDQHNWDWFMHDADLFLDAPLSTGTAGTAVLHTIDLPTGYSYRLTACAESTGYFRSFGYRGNDDGPLSLEVETSDNVAWSFTGVDQNYEIWTHDKINFGVYVPDSTNTEIAVINSNGDEIWREGAGGDSFSTQGWIIDCGDELTFRAIAQVWNDNLQNTEEQVIDYPHTITVKTRGELPVPVMTVDFGNNQDGVLFRGQQISFSFEENADIFENGQRKEQYEGVWYNAYLWDSHGKILDSMENAQPGTQLAFTSGNLGADDTYRVSVDIQKQQYTGIATDVWFMLLEGTADSDHTVTLTVAEAYINCPPNVEIPYTISAPGSVVVQIYADNEWREWWEDMPDTFTRSRNFDTGERFLMARASWENPDDEEDRVWAYSNPVILHVYGDSLPAPTLTLGATEITRGDDLTVTIAEGDMTDIELVRKYYIHVRSKETDKEYIRYGFKSYEMTDGSITLPFSTAGLPAGEYNINVDGAADGYDWASDEEDFIVTGETTITGVHITASPESTNTSNNITITAFAPGATYIRIYERAQQEGQDDEVWDEIDAESLINSYSDNNPNTHQLYVMAWYNNDDPNEVEGTVSKETAEISFTANDELDAPKVFYSSMLEEDDDFWMEMGYSDGATEYYLNIRDESITEGENNIYSVSSSEPINVTLPRNQFITGHEYSIGVSVSAPGYQGNYREYRIIVATPVQGFTLTVNGSTGDTSIPVNRNFSVLATAPAGATGISVLHPDGWWNDRCGRTFEEYRWNSGEVRQNVVLIARYTTFDFPAETQAEDYDWSQFDWDQVEWVGYSNPVTVTFTAAGELPEFTYTIEDSTVNQGEYIHVTLTNVDAVIASIRSQLGDDVDSFDRNQLGFYAMIQTEDGRDLLPYWYEWDGLGQINVPTAEVDLSSGNNLKLLMNVNYGEGWVGWGTEENVTINAAQGGAYFVASKTSVITSENFTVSLHVPDAVRVAIYEIGTNEGGYSYSNRMSENNGDTLVWMHSYGNSGTLTLYAYAQFEEEPDDYEAAWTRVNGLTPITMTVTAGESQVINGAVTVPNRISGNSDLNISWSSNTILDKVDLQIHCVDEGRQVWHSNHMNNQTGTTIPAIMPLVQDGDNFDAYIAAGDPVFESGHIYRAQIYMQKVGWEADYHEVYFTVDDAVSRTLTLPSALTTIENEAFAGVNANRIEIGSNVETIEYRAFADIDGLVYADFANGNVEIQGGAFENTRVVILCYQESDAYNYARGNNIPYLLK